jgi:hypothetical protein
MYSQTDVQIKSFFDINNLNVADHETSISVFPGSELAAGSIASNRSSYQ